MKKAVICLIILLLVAACANERTKNPSHKAETDNGKFFFLIKEDIKNGAHHTSHSEIFGKYVEGYNKFILEGIDKVQKTAPEGGGYFIGIKADPPESPLGYKLKLFGRTLLDLERKTSYCSGSTYGAFIEALNMIFPGGAERLSDDRYESLRMQEPDGGRRNDGVKFWGKWNDDGFGTQFALVQYSGMGEEIKPSSARPGDFVNISWKNGGGHSVVFLGWRRDEENQDHIVYWSSQKGTDGYGDQVVSLERIKEVKFVRLTNPEKLFSFDVNTDYTRDIPGDEIIMTD